MSLQSALRAGEQRVYARLRSPEAASAASLPRAPWNLDELAAHEYCLVVTWRRDGRGVATPVWFARFGDGIVLRSAATDGKAKRMRNDASVLVCGCTFGGKPLGPPMEGRARFLTAPETGSAEAALRARYGFRRRAYAFVRDPLLDAAYVEVTSADADAD